MCDAARCFAGIPDGHFPPHCTVAARRDGFVDCMKLGQGVRRVPGLLIRQHRAAMGVSSGGSQLAGVVVALVVSASGALRAPRRQCPPSGEGRVDDAELLPNVGIASHGLAKQSRKFWYLLDKASPSAKMSMATRISHIGVSSGGRETGQKAPRGWRASY
jgi:hypothetical protein